MHSLPNSERTHQGTDSLQMPQLGWGTDRWVYTRDHAKSDISASVQDKDCVLQSLRGSPTIPERQSELLPPFLDLGAQQIARILQEEQHSEFPTIAQCHWRWPVLDIANSQG